MYFHLLALIASLNTCIDNKTKNNDEATQYENILFLQQSIVLSNILLYICQKYLLRSFYFLRLFFLLINHLE